MPLDRFPEGNYTYFHLRISCPVCIDQGRNVAQSFWSHYKCGGPIYVGDNAFFKCSKCGDSGHVKEWSFNCPEHANTQILFLKPSSQGFAQAISTAGQMVSETGHRWLIEFMRNMGEF